jgi:anti-sigma regulatory factor (Ser/Thr protein kinase)
MNDSGAQGEVLYRESYGITGNDFEHGGDVATRVKSVLKELGIDSATVRRLSIANFEAEMNVIMYAERATLDLTVSRDEIRVAVTDRGPGIPDVEQAMQEGFSTATSQMRSRGFGAGMGLPNMKRNTDRFEVESVPGRGTTLRYAVRLVSAGAA